MIKELKPWVGIVVGCTIMAAGFVLFINPYNIVPGGAYGSSIVMHHLFPSIQVGTFGYMFEIPLLIMSWLLLGSKLGSRTVVAALITPLIMNILSESVYPTREALDNLDPTQLLGGLLDLSDHLVISVIMGAIMIGSGCGIVVRCHATSGGTDIVAMIIQKYCNVRFSTAVFLVDGVVVMAGLLVIGLGIGTAEAGSATPALYLSLYSLLAIFIMSRVVARVISGPKEDKMIFIIGDPPMIKLHSFILHELDRTATCFKSMGLYSGSEKEMLMMVVSYKEVARVKSKIKETDPNAFVIVTDAYDTYGERWKALPAAGEVQPE